MNMKSTEHVPRMAQMKNEYGSWKTRTEERAWQT